MSTTTRVRFNAEIYKSGIQRCVEVPERVSKALGGKSRIPVIVTVAGDTFQTTLMPVGDGRHRMFVSGPVRKRLKVDAGDEITVELSADPAHGEARDVPGDLADAIRFASLTTLFEELTPRQRREMIAFVERAKKPETREKYIARVLNVLAERER